MQAASVNGINLHYRLSGRRDAPAIVFANSLGSDLRIWDEVAERLEPDWRILRYDKRGHGLSDCPPAPYSMQDHVDDLAALMDHCAMKAALVTGLSVGGMIAQGLLASRPDLVSALILSDTAHQIGNDDLWNQRIEAVTTMGIAAISEAILERWFPPSFREREPARFALAANMLTRTPVDGYAGTCAALRDADYTEEAKRIAVPVRLIVGSNDGSTPVDLMRQTEALIPGSRLDIIEGPGHLPCMEEPGHVAAIIAAFAREIAHV